MANKPNPNPTAPTLEQLLPAITNVVKDAKIGDAMADEFLSALQKKGLSLTLNGQEVVLTSGPQAAQIKELQTKLSAHESWVKPTKQKVAWGVTGVVLGGATAIGLQRYGVLDFSKKNSDDAGISGEDSYGNVVNM